MNRNITILICGDFVPLSLVDRISESGSFCCLEGFNKYIQQVDYSVINFESPVVKNKANSIIKSGPNLKCSAKAMEYVASSGFNCVTLANNHFFDYGQDGVDDTISACNTNKIDYVGGGKDMVEARKVLFKMINNKILAFINACEHEFSIANAEHGGSNPLDLINMQEDIAIARAKADYVVLILHGGVELYHYPTPRMKRWYRHFVDLGADAVINHHQHCINGYEVYKGKPIFYGLGNFYFPGGRKSPDSWKYGYAVKLSLDKMIGFDLIPYKQTEEGLVLRETGEFNEEIDKLNYIIKDDSALQIEFDRFVKKREYYLKTQLFPSLINCRIITGLANRGLLGSLYNNEQLYALKNKLTCESHYETLQRLFHLETE